MTKFNEPRFALIEVEGGFVVERFDPDRHLSVHGWSRAGISLFEQREDVAHLRDLILN